MKLNDTVKIEILSKATGQSTFKECKVIKITAKRFTVEYDGFTITFTNQGIVYDNPFHNCEVFII